MNRWPRSDRTGASVGDTLIFLATLSVGAALLYPAWSVRDFRARVDQAIEDVTTLSQGARVVLAESGRWPTPAPPGSAPSELGRFAGSDGIFDRVGYTVGWSALDVVDSVMAPPPEDVGVEGDAPLDAGPLYLPTVRTMGAVTVSSSEPDLLAELLDRFGEPTSFVVDTTWFLVLPERAEPFDFAP